MPPSAGRMGRSFKAGFIVQGRDGHITLQEFVVSFPLSAITSGHAAWIFLFRLPQGPLRDGQDSISFKLRPGFSRVLIIVSTQRPASDFETALLPVSGTHNSARGSAGR